MLYNNIDSLNDEQARELCELYQQEWWTRGRSLEDVAAMLASSPLVYGITDENGALVGFARVLSDTVFKALIFDVIVDRSHRGHALGRRLMERIHEDPRLAGVKHFELYCLPELEPFYEALGYTRDVAGVALMRRGG